MDLLSVVGLAVVLFATTNIDDLFVLIGFLSHPRFRFRQVLIGQFLGVGLLTAVSLLGASIALVLQREYVGLLGLLPLLIGLKKLQELRSGSADDGDDDAPQARASGLGNIAAVAGVTIANGGDNIGIYIPAFAVRSLPELAVVLMVFALMLLLWVWLARWLVTRPALEGPVRRYGAAVTPVVLILLGLLILFESGSFGLFFG